jgi:hypothetical protein
MDLTLKNLGVGIVLDLLINGKDIFRDQSTVIKPKTWCSTAAATTRSSLSAPVCGRRQLILILRSVVSNGSENRPGV